MSLNQGQALAANTLEGLVKVSAGAGTGKTFTLVQRCLNLFTKYEPEGVLLLTFTEAAANNMKDRLLKKVESPELKDKVRQMQISTFHAFARRILSEQGHLLTQLGFEHSLFTQFSIIEQERAKLELFKSFYHTWEGESANYFKSRYPEKENALFKLLEQLLARGLYPSKYLWTKVQVKMLEGDKETALERLLEMDEEATTKDGPKKLMQKYQKRRLDKSQVDEALKAELGSLKLGENIISDELDKHDEKLFKKVGDLLFAYTQAMIAEQSLTFNLLISLVLGLFETVPESREAYGFKAIMVDEFQDTDESQFLFLLHCLKEPNLMVVGDFRQSIYSFRYAQPENLVEFENKLRNLVQSLGAKHLPAGSALLQAEVTEIDLNENYRSPQAILDLADMCLSAPIKKEKKQVKPDRLTKGSLLSQRSELSKAQQAIRLMTSTGKRSHEFQALLAHLQTVLAEPSDYPVFDQETEVFRDIRPSDMVVLFRGNQAAAEFKLLCDEAGMSVNYQAGLPLSDVYEFKLLLAWLRVLNGVELLEGLEFLKLHYPEVYENAKSHSTNFFSSLSSNTAEFLPFKNKPLVLLQALQVKEPGALRAQVVFALSELLAKLESNLSLTAAQWIANLKDWLEEGESLDLKDLHAGEGVTLMSIHKAKGLEWPWVHLANVNSQSFPSTKKDYSEVLCYSPYLGLREYKRTENFSQELGLSGEKENGLASIFFNALSGDSDEERRLFYVAITRAQQYYSQSAHERASAFHDYFDALKQGVLYENLEAGFPQAKKEKDSEESLRFAVDLGLAPLKGSYEYVPFPKTAHDDFKEIKLQARETQGKGKNYGTAFHLEMERRLLGRWQENKSEIDKKELLWAFKEVERLEQQGYGFQTEVKMLLPKGGQIYRGVIDALAESEAEVLIIDYKTDVDRQMEPNYKKQLTLYKEAVSGAIVGKKVRAELWYVGMREKVEV